MQLLGKAQKPAVVVFSDLHVGSVVGLWPHRHAIEGGGKYEENVYQQWLLSCWHEAMKEVADLKPKPVVVLNGDALQGINYKDGQLVTANINIQMKAALKLLAPLRESARKFYVIRGTEWHEGKAADFLEPLAMMLEAEKDPASGQDSWWELYFNLGGAKGHFGHHIGMSSVSHYESTVPYRELIMLMSELARFKGPDIRFIVRSHRHSFIHVDAPPDIHAIVTPAWQLKTAFAHKRVSAKLPQIGWVRIELDDGEIMVRKRLFDLPEIKVETI